MIRKLLGEAALAWKVQQSCERVISQFGSPSARTFARLRPWLQWALPPLLVVLLGLRVFSDYLLGQASQWNSGLFFLIVLSSLATGGLAILIYIQLGLTFFFFATTLHWTTFDHLRVISPAGRLLARHRSVLPWLIYLGFWIGLTFLVGCWLDPAVFAGNPPGVVGEQEVWQAVVIVPLPALAYSGCILLVLLLAHPRTGGPVFGLVALSLLAPPVYAVVYMHFWNGPPFSWPSFEPSPIWPIGAVVGLALTLGLQCVVVEKAFRTIRQAGNDARDRRRRPRIVASAPVPGSSHRFDYERDRTRTFRSSPQGLLGASWFYYRQQFAAAIIECRTWGCLVLLIVVLLIVAASILYILSNPPDPVAITQLSRLYGIAFGLAFVLVGRGPWSVPHPVRLFLWGVPFRRQLYVRLASSCLDPGFLLFFLGGLVWAAAVDWSWAAPTALLILGFKIFKTGLLAWPNLLLHVSGEPSPPETRGGKMLATPGESTEWARFRKTLQDLSVIGAILGFEFALIGGGVTIRPNDPFWGVAVLQGGVMIVLGLAGILYKLLALDENWLRQHSIQVGERRFRPNSMWFDL